MLQHVATEMSTCCDRHVVSNAQETSAAHAQFGAIVAAVRELLQTTVAQVTATRICPSPIADVAGVSPD